MAAETDHLETASHARRVDVRVGVCVGRTRMRLVMMNGRAAVAAVVLVARQVFELRVTTAQFLAQGPVGRVHLVSLLIDRKPRQTKNKNKRPTFRY